MGVILMKINCKNLSIFVILLMVEIAIALFIHDKIIRPFIGDVLVVCLIYFFLKSFINKGKFLILYVFLFACFIEFTQYLNIISFLHLENVKIVQIVLGSTFDVGDIFCYFIGTVLIYAYEKLIFNYTFK
ncbi:DUF2809 domain-containing protein [Clostridium chromiireducens]